MMSFMGARQHQRLVEWNDTSKPRSTKLRLHRLVQAQADQTPASVAVIYDAAPTENLLTYRQLMERANLLTGRLRSRGVGPETVVGLYLDRSPDAIIAQLAILAAGGAYLPLDPSYPRRRLVSILEDARPRVIVTARRWLDRWPLSAEVLCIDSEDESPPPILGRPPSDLQADRLSADHPAYVLTTSGSTGRPRCVVIPHRAICNHRLWMQSALPLAKSDRVLHKAPLGFDASVWEIWAPLVAGAQVVVARPEGHRDPEYLVEVLRRQRITVLHAVPSLLRMLLEHPGFKLCRDLRRVCCGGELLPVEMKERFFALGLDAELVNLYGPTETTIQASFAVCENGSSTASVPLGRPITNARVALLDRRARPVPGSDTGEIHIGGAGLARGYLGQPRFSAERFIPDALGGGSVGGRLFKTGDRARHQSDGQLCFRGRLDQQVKIRGYRVELGEVEALLRQHPRVEQAVAMIRQVAFSGQTREALVAYFVPTGEPTSATQLETHMRERAPDFMIPTFFVALESLPINVHGKVDRRALAELPAPRRAPLVPASTPLEEDLMRMFREVLDVPRIGATETFLELGGDSIQAARLINQLQAKLGETLYVSALFEAPTVARLAGYLEQHYATAVAKIWGSRGLAGPETERRIGRADAAHLRQLIVPLAPRRRASRRNPPAVFVLSPPRSGSTLFRIMLAGHPKLFSPPAPGLLMFNTLEERRDICVGRLAFLREGTLRAIMEIRGCPVGEAERIMADRERRGWSVRRFYRQLQEWIGERTLVDKTTSYAHDLATLQRAESDFEKPLYLHLVRHPCGMIHSFREARIDRVFRFDNPFSPRQLAELVWLICHQNILRFLKGVPEERQHRIRFEEMVQRPEEILGGVCRFLGLPPHPDVVDPYSHPQRRMTDGLYPESRMIGDYKFRQHGKLDPAVADRWRDRVNPDSLGHPTRKLARELGYTSSVPEEIGGAKESSRLTPIPRATPTHEDRGAKAYPLSFAQQRLWFLEQMNPGDSVHNTASVWRLEGDVDPSHLELALRQILRRHDGLRTSFLELDERPAQRVFPEGHLRLWIVDLEALEPSQRQRQSRQIAKTLALQRFELERAPLMRVAWIRSSATDSLLVLALHHIVSDGWSKRVLSRELSSWMRAIDRGQRPNLPRLPAQYADFSVWQRQRLADGSRELTESRQYWRRQLASPSRLELPSDRPHRRSYRGTAMPMTVDVELVSRLRRLGRECGTTLYMTLLAAFMSFLYRLTEHRDLIVGSPIARRDRPETEHLIGYFVNMLAMRTRIGRPGIRFREILDQVRRLAIEAFAHQQLPFERIVEELAPDRDPHRHPLFQVTFALQQDPRAELVLPGVSVSPQRLDTGTVRFDLEWHLAVSPRDDLSGVLTYSTDLFDPSTIARWSAGILGVLRAIVENADARLTDLPMLSPAQKHQLIVEWNDSRLDWGDGSLHPLIEDRIAQDPERPAVVWQHAEGEVHSMSYRLLDHRSSRLARALLELGVSPESRVAILLDREPALVVAMLGILRAGGTYLPLDPASPPRRLQQMLADSDPQVLIRGIALESPNAGRSWIYLERSGEVASVKRHVPSQMASREPREPPPREIRIRPGNTAYLLYTSGSTGQPKGTLISHAAIRNHMQWMQTDLPLHAEDRVLQKTPATFDASIWEFWAPLMVGGRLVLAPPDAHRDPAALLRAVREHRITILQVVPSLLQELLGLDGFARCTSLRRVYCGGEPLTSALVRRYLEQGPPAALLNVYGPTEATIHASFEPTVTATERPQAALGRPVANARLVLVDRHLEPVPIGGVGELLIAGHGLGRGYLGRPGLTAETFIPDPFGLPGRLYRTGDLARQHVDGRLEFLGRRDHQIKLRGQRIEPGEIEAALLDHPGIARAVVLARTGAADQHLVAHVVPSTPSNAALSASDLRRFLRDRLPMAWVPSLFAIEPALPLTPSGKVDRRALARHALQSPQRPAQGETYEPPKTPTEGILASIWSRVLGVPRIGRSDHFFDLGGHSLLATRVASRIRKSLTLELPLRAIFENPTLRDLAARLEQIQALGAGLELPPLVRTERTHDLPLSFAQRRLWFLYQLEPASPAYNMSSTFDLEGPLAVPTLERGLRRLAQRHESLRTTFTAVDGRPRQHIARKTNIQLARIDLAALPPSVCIDEAARWADRLAHLPFDLERGPLLRTALWRLATGDPAKPARHVLFCGQHHIISDGWSLEIFHRELSELYRAPHPKQPAQLPKLEVQYPDYAAWQRQWPAATLASQLDYWRQRLADLPQLDLPTDRPRPDLSSHRGARRPLHLSEASTAALQRLGGEHGSSLFMTLLTAFMVLVGRASGQRDLVVGTPIANRNRVEIEGLLGFFVNSLVLRADLSGNPDFQELLTRVRETSLEAYAHQDLPFERLVEELSPSRQTNRHPLFQVSFALQNTAAPKLEFPGLKVSMRPPKVQAARFDLEVVWREAPAEAGRKGLDGAIIYSTDLFDATTIDRLADHLVTLLRAVAERPSARLLELDILGRAQRHQLLQEWSPTPRPAASETTAEGCLHLLFEEQVRRAPKAVAVHWSLGELTFHQLNVRADQLAMGLRNHGVGPEDVVGLFLERSPDMVTAVLGILKAGAAYLPLPPSTPRRRLSALLSQARVGVVVTDERLQTSLPESVGIQLISDARLESMTGSGAPSTGISTRGDHAAYVLFTSGSTGRPKGVVVSHRAAATYLGWAVEAYRLTSGRRGAMLCSDLAFDLTLTSLFTPLLAGRSLEVLPEDGGMAALAEVLDQTPELSLLKLTPSHLSALRHAWDDGRALVGNRNSPGTLVIGGEALTYADLELWRRRTPGTRLVNEYGPTEAVVACSAHTVSKTAPSTGAVPIGRPIASSRIFLLDDGYRPIAPGMPGELYIGGNLARGYLHGARATAGNFLPDPFTRVPGSRLYRTGDRARHLRDGNLVFLGRADDQIKLRGFRIEPGEIAAALEEHPDVRSAAVLAHSSPERLVAYVVPRLDETDRRQRWQRQQISEWRKTYDHLYHDAERQGGVHFELAGWRSTYTGEPIPEVEMREWLALTVERIESLKPRRMLEIGCGTGLLLFKLAPRCQHYLGVDFSPQVIHHLKKRVRRTLPHVDLEIGEADRIRDLADGPFDTVVLNSVVQYFPSQDYLLEVLRGAVAVAGHGASIFVGDVRSLPLLDAFCASVELARAEASLPTSQLCQRIGRRRRHERELVIAPELFFELAKGLPRLTSVEIEPKLGSADNELTRFRYDVTLRLDGEDNEEAVDALSLDASAATAADFSSTVRRWLTEQQPLGLELKSVANTRLMPEMRLLKLLAEDRQPPATVGALRKALDPPVQGMTPADLQSWVADLPYRLSLSWAAGRGDGSYDARFLRQLEGDTTRPIRWSRSAEVAGNPLSTQLTNDPLQERGYSELTPRLRDHLSRRLPPYMLPSAYQLLASLPLAASGKIDRKALAALDGERPASAKTFIAPRNATEERLATIWSDILDIPRVGIHDNFFEIGGDSILSIQIIARARLAGVELAPRDLFDHQTVAELARQAGTPSEVSAPQGIVTGPIALTPIQHWFFERRLPEPWHYNWAVMYRSRQPLDAGILRRALDHLIRHHDALRMRFEDRAGVWRQRGVGLGDSIPFCHLDLSRLADTAAFRSTAERASAQLQASLDLTRGPLLRLAWFDRGSTFDHEDGPRLMLTVHHLVVDAISWTILKEDLESVYRQLAAGQSVTLPAKTTAFRDWAAQLEDHAKSPEARRESGFWTPLARAASDQASRLPQDMAGEDNSLSSAATVTTALSADATLQLLRDVPRAYRTRVDDVLLTALLGAFSSWTGQPELLIDLEGHGREEIFGGVDLSRTVGWFTSLFPARLIRPKDASPGTALKNVKEQLRQVPHRGFGEGLLRYLSTSEEAEELRRAPRPQIRFNYLGRRDAAGNPQALFAATVESTGPKVSPRGERSHLLEIDAAIKNDRLRLRWTFSRDRHRPATIERVARSLLDKLEDLIEHCRSPQAWGRTPSDFPLAALDPKRLDRLLSSLEAPREIEDIYPLTAMQEGMLFHSLYDPDSSVYFEQSAWALPANLDIEALRQAWRQVIERHAVLRTALAWKDLPRPLQIVYRDVDLPWHELNPGHDISFESLRNADLRRGFELERAPLMRLTLIRWHDGSYRFLWSTHHALLDGWSSARIRWEVWTLYEAIREGRQADLEAPIPYRRFVSWCESRDRDAAAIFWRQMLAGFEPQPLSVEGQGDGEGLGQVKRQLSLTATAELESLARGHRLTLNTLVQGAWALMLARASGRDDLALGVTVAGRTPALAGSDAMVGLLINTLPLRVQIRRDSELWAWLSALQELNLEMRQHETSPLVEIQDHAGAKEPGSERSRVGSRAHRPLFESIFLFQRHPIRALDLEQRLGVRRLPHTGRTNYPLVMTAIPGRQLRLELGFAAERFGAVSMTRALSHLCTLLQGMSAAQGLGDLPWLSRAERHQLLLEWNDTRVAAPDAPCLHRLFERQAARTPDRIALVFEHRGFTFESLERHADQLARHLADLGIGRGHYVPVLMHQRPEVPVAWLATMKAGAAFVPLDARWPEERIAGILEELGSRIVLVNDRRFEQRWGGYPVDLSKPPRPTSDPAIRVALEAPIYAIYTSGSTGRPKAAINTHGGVANRLRWMDRRFADTAEPVVLQTTYFTFDSAVWQLFWPMLAGGRSVMPDVQESYDPEALIAMIDRQRITFTDFVPSVFDLLIERLERRTPRGRRLAYLHHLVVGGEAIHRAAIMRFARLFPGVRLTNLYGPTETAIGVISHPVENLEVEGEIPIGRPIDNAAAVVLDSELAPVAIGETGEIYLGGLPVGLGYLGDARRSAEVFVDNPFPEIAGSKIYKTGDLARTRADGNIEFLGRVDRQVKIRGFRVEPEEIESRLVMHPAIREAVVVVPGDSVSQRLVGCLVSHEADRSATAIEVRGWLEQRLPEYMVPAELIFFDKLPRTAGGKIDQHELRRRADLSARSEASSTPSPDLLPGDPLERELADIWSRILRRGRVGVRDSFFALGGHSLLAVRLMTLIESRLGVALPLASLFDEPTIAGQARLLRRRRPPESSPLVALRRDGSSAPFFCVHPIGGHAMCYVELARHLGENQPFFGLQARGLDNPARPHLDIPTMAADYLAAVRSRQPQGPLHLGGWSMGALVAYEMACQLRAQGHPVALLALIDPAAPVRRTQPDGDRPEGFGFGAGSDEIPRLEIDWHHLRQLPPHQALRRLYEQARRAAVFEGSLGHSRLRVLYNLVRDQVASLSESDLEPRWKDLVRHPSDEILDKLYRVAEQAVRVNADFDLIRQRDLYTLFECNLRAMHDFSPRAFDGEVVLLRARGGDASDPTRGWDQLAQSVEVCELPGDHYSIVRDPDVRHLADRLLHYLAKATPG